MTAVAKIDSNVTGLRYAEEASIGVLPGASGDPPTDNSATWQPLEPNSYSDFGGQLALLARNPINDSRQRKKGLITDLDASGGFQMDLTQTNLQDLLQGFMFADAREKNGSNPTAVAAGTGVYSTDDTTDVVVGSIVNITGCTNAANNGRFNVTAVSTDVSITTDNSSSVAEPAPPATAKIVVVGFLSVSDDLDVTASAGGTFATIDCGTADPTDWGLIPGEWIYVGDGTNDFGNAANNGWKRVKSVAATGITIDKSDLNMVTETDPGNSVVIFFGRVLKNELSTLIKRRSYTLERKLGAPDDAQPTWLQAEYLVGAIPNELTLNIAQADKVTCDLSFVASDNETTAATAANTSRSDHASANSVALVESDAFNTSSDFSRMRLAVYDAVTPDEAPSPLFVYLTNLTLGINNNVTQNKAVSILGAFDSTAGTFEVGGEMEAYFADVASVAAVRANSDVTLDIIMAKANTGIAIDIPMIALGNARLDVQQDQAIKLPLDTQAATGAKYDTNMDHTILFCFFDYLPDVAAA